MSPERRTTLMAVMVSVAEMLREDGVTEEEFGHWATAAWNADVIVRRTGTECANCGGTGRVHVGKHIVRCLSKKHNSEAEEG